MHESHDLYDFVLQLLQNPSPWIGGILGGLLTGGLFGWLSHVRNIRPVLVFLYKIPEGWQLQNVGLGPAIRLIVAHAANDKTWMLPTLYPSLSKDGSVSLSDVSPAAYLAVKYTDANGHWYSTECGFSLNQPRKHWAGREPYKDWVPLRKLEELNAVARGEMSRDQLNKRIQNRKRSGKFEGADSLDNFC